MELFGNTIARTHRTVHDKSGARTRVESMEQLGLNLDGDDWQKLVLRLLVLRYSLKDLVVVPDEHQGDFGIEAFSLDGNAYQCYAVREPVSVNVRYQRQRDKIHDDLQKFVCNREDLIKLLGQTKIRTWLLVVQIHDSAKLIQYAQTKAEEVRRLHLPYVTDDFTVNIITADFFPREVATLLGEGIQKIHVDAASVQKSEISEWANQNDELVNTLDGKLRVIPKLRVSRERRILRDQLLEMYLNAQNVLHELRQYPVLYEQVVGTKENRARFLPADSSTTKLSIYKVRIEFAGEVARSVKGIDESTAELIAYGAVAEWLLTCPLTPKEG